MEEEWDEQYESDEDYDNEDEWDEKPPATRLFLEQDATTSFIEKYSRCPNCTGPVEVKVKTICLASSLVIGCKDEDCGFVDHSVAPIAAKI